jgi:uncharacterized protein YegL
MTKPKKSKPSRSKKVNGATPKIVVTKEIAAEVLRQMEDIKKKQAKLSAAAKKGVETKRKKAEAERRKLAAAQRKKTQKKVAKPIAKATPLINRVGLVIDCSGSMMNVFEEALRQLKKNISDLRGNSIRFGQETRISLLAFGTTSKWVLKDCDIADALIPSTLRCDLGGTALFDAVDEMMEHLNSFQDRGKNQSFLVSILTDGEERDSRNTTAYYLSSAIKRQQATDRWSFVFSGPPGSRRQIVSTLGLPEGNTIEWEQNIEGVRNLGSSISRGFSNYYGSRAAGHASTKGFFTTDLSKVKSSDVQKKLDDIRPQVKIWEVPREVAIREFVEDKLGTYTLGSAYYQLSKDELVQGHKDVLVMKKGERPIYGGFQARQLLGLPSGDVKLRPGNHGAWDVFIQSTSVNRKLVRGTKLIVRA